MSLLPANVGTGHVTGVFVNSDGQAETGKVWLRPRFTSAKITTADPPTTVLPTPRSVQIGEDGRMAETEVVATSDPDLGLEAWTYEVTFKFDSGVTYGPFDIDVPEGETVDLTLVAPAAAANGVQTIRGFGVPDPAEAADGDVVSYDATAGVTTWWSRADAVGQALGDEFDDPDSPLHGSIDAAVGRVTDEALESRLSRVDRTRHAPSLGLYFPEAEGAVADGEIDATQAIQSAINTAAETGGSVHLAPGTYLSGPLTFSSDRTVLIGSGWGSVIQSTAGPGQTLITFNDSNTPVRGLRLRDVYINGSGSEDALLQLDYALDGIIEGCTVTGSGGVGIRANRPQNLNIVACEIRDNGSWGISVEGFRGNTGQLCKIVRNTVFRNGFSVPATGGISLQGGGEHLVAYNQVESHHADPEAVGILVTSLRQQIIGNTFELNNINMQFGNDSFTSGRCTVEANQIVGGEIRWINYAGGDSFARNVLEDRVSGEQWSVTFEASPQGGNAHTWWHDNYEEPLGNEADRITINAAPGSVMYERSWFRAAASARHAFRYPLPDGNVAPPIYGAEYVTTNNSSPTTYTAFVGGFAGKVLTIRTGDDNTTFTNGGSLHLSGAGNFVASTGATLTLINDDGTNWYEVSRSEVG